MNRPNTFIIWSGYCLALVLLLVVLSLRTRIRELEQREVPTVSVVQPKAARENPQQTSIPSGNVKFQDARTQQLFGELDEIAASSKPGEVNERFQARAMELLLDNDFERRTRNFGTLLDILRPEDGPALHLAFQKAHREGRDYGDEYARFATKWGKLDGAGALTYLLQSSPTIPSWDVHNLLKGWSQENPQEALAWTVANRERIQQQNFGPPQDPLEGVLRAGHGQIPMPPPRRCWNSIQILFPACKPPSSFMSKASLDAAWTLPWIG